MSNLMLKILKFKVINLNLEFNKNQKISVEKDNKI
jgi:hypothetical protein